ncbi:MULTISPECIES: hypothetical protein [unclassified Limnobacter]|uniref:hypothetical protein n=1 Tax=unclassified Limnobacter TaxID=2630203 RepID=UPI000156CA3B|nr:MULTISPECIES: hypothetical protein [unclassified Limnobacter]EDM84574.1 hypothetical protein LMED105_03465 [Limnobacter sp. MED105]VWX34790.1 conserved hypothetical protein [Limnobacter sp. 130]
MEVIQAGDRVFNFADRHGKNVNNMLARSDFGDSPVDSVMLNYEIQMMGSLWQLAAGLVKDLTEPLKSIVNK